MFYLIIHLNDRGCKEDVMLAMAAAGVLDAVVVPATSVAERMADGIPLFAGFRADLTARDTSTLVIGAVVPDEETLERLKQELLVAGVDLKTGQAGRFIVLPIAEMLGTEPAE